MCLRNLNHCCQAVYGRRDWWCGLCRRSYKLIRAMQNRTRMSNVEMYEEYLKRGISLGVRSASHPFENAIEAAFHYGYLNVILYVARVMHINMYDHENTGAYNNIVSITYGKFWMFNVLHKMGLMDIRPSGWYQNDLVFAARGIVYGRVHVIPYLDYMAKDDKQVDQSCLNKAIISIHHLNNYYSSNASLARTALWKLYDASYIRYEQFLETTVQSEGEFVITDELLEAFMMWYIIGFDQSNNILCLLLIHDHLTLEHIKHCVEYVNGDQFTSDYDNNITVSTIPSANHMQEFKSARIDDLNKILSAAITKFHASVRAHIREQYGEVYEYLVMRYVV